mgnify:CR=1 FL=1
MNIFPPPATVSNVAATILQGEVLMLTDPIPSRAECYRLIEEHRMLPNIREHSELVMRVALAIADNLRTGVRVNRDLVAAAALLHDITKTRSLSTKEKHDITGANLLRDLGYARVGEIVRAHVLFSNFIEDGPLEDREIVYYADKRVMHATIVSVHERVADLVARYGKTPEIIERITANKRLILAIEGKIQRAMAIAIDEAIANIDE